MLKGKERQTGEGFIILRYHGVLPKGSRNKSSFFSGPTTKAFSLTHGRIWILAATLMTPRSSASLRVKTAVTMANN